MNLRELAEAVGILVVMTTAVVIAFEPDPKLVAAEKARETPPAAAAALAGKKPAPAVPEPTPSASVKEKPAAEARRSN